MSPSPPVSIAIRFTYVLQDWQQHTWPQQPPGGMWTFLIKKYSAFIFRPILFCNIYFAKGSCACSVLYCLYAQMPFCLMTANTLPSPSEPC